MSARTFGLSDAVAMSADAVRVGIAREENGLAFASYLTDAYDGEDTAYVQSLSLSTLYGRFLAEPR